MFFVRSEIYPINNNIHIDNIKLHLDDIVKYFSHMIPKVFLWVCIISSLAIIKSSVTHYVQLSVILKHVCMSEIKLVVFSASLTSKCIFHSCRFCLLNSSYGDVPSCHADFSVSIKAISDRICSGTDYSKVEPLLHISSEHQKHIALECS